MRPVWPQGLERPAKGEWPPDTLNWDLFIGPPKMKPYHSLLHPWNWRAWWDYDTGALGDMACHIVDNIFKALRLEYPIRTEEGLARKVRTTVWKQVPTSNIQAP